MSARSGRQLGARAQVASANAGRRGPDTEPTRAPPVLGRPCASRAPGRGRFHRVGGAGDSPVLSFDAGWGARERRESTACSAAAGSYRAIHGRRRPLPPSGAVLGVPPPALPLRSEPGGPVLGPLSACPRIRHRRSASAPAAPVRRVEPAAFNGIGRSIRGSSARSFVAARGDPPSSSPAVGARPVRCSSRLPPRRLNWPSRASGATQLVRSGRPRGLRRDLAG